MHFSEISAYQEVSVACTKIKEVQIRDSPTIGKLSINTLIEKFKLIVMQEKYISNLLSNLAQVDYRNSDAKIKIHDFFCRSSFLHKRPIDCVLYEKNLAGRFQEF